VQRVAILLVCLVLAAAVSVFAFTRVEDEGGSEPKAAPPPAVVVWAVGDGGDGTREAKAVGARIAADRPQRVLYLGDVYERGTLADFRKHFATVYGRLVQRMEPTLGNHEWPRRTQGYHPYWRSIKGRRVARYYAFTVGGWRFISLNSEDPGDPRQLSFLRRELARAPGTCVMPYWHRPRFNAGEHQAEEANVQPLWLQVKGRVPAILSGHDHNLQRFLPRDGTIQYVAGAGGRERHDVDERDARLAFSRDAVDGALRMRLAPGIARLSFVSVDGQVLDRSTVRCRPG